ncbi:hypothetical protein [Streptomyces sp. NPDC126499]|uniref:hypothetical protein n=1 Tax=Streptomyces sp. NPDC126499 TaxID=3155314 RepID=UPI00331C3062
MDDNDRDRSRLAPHLAVVTVDKTLQVTAHDGHQESLSRARVAENVKGALPAALDVTQTLMRALPSLALSAPTSPSPRATT